MQLVHFLERKNSEFQKLCKDHKVHKLFAFGSSIRNDFDQKTSDIDLLVLLDVEDPLERGDLLLSFWDQMELFFSRKVDLITEESIRNTVLKGVVNREKKLIYDREAA